MVDDIAIQEFINAIKDTPQDTNKVYSATVSRVDSDGVVWVNIHGSDMETPTASTSTEVQRGDAVTVQWRNNKLYIGGNYSNPSAGMFRVANVESNAFTALNTAENAWQFASDANALANNAMVSANGKNSIYYTATAPTSGTYKIGDTWFNSSEDNAIYTWDGTAWTKEELGEDAIANLSITNAKIADATIQNGKIANLDAAKITTGTLAAARIGAGSITIGKIDSETTEQILNSNIQVGGRNLLLGSKDYKDWSVSGNITFTTDSPTDIANFPAVTSMSTYQPLIDTYKIDYSQIRNRDCVLSMYVKAASGVNISIMWQYEVYAVNSTSRLKYGNMAKTITGTGGWNKLTFNLAVDDSIFTQGTGTPDYNNCEIRMSVWRNPSVSYMSAFQLKRLKLELGNKETDWTPAPEDAEDYTDEVAATLSDSFNGSLAETASELSGSIDEVRTLAGSKADATALSTLTTQMQEYIGEGGYIYANNGTLIIATGRDIGNFKIGIDGTQIVFYQNDNAVAYINNNTLYISRSEVTNEQKISNFAFKKRDGGRFTLMYVGG